MTMGHRVAVLDGGRLQQCGTPRELYEHPVNLFVAGFIGSPAMNLCPAPVDRGVARLGPVQIPLGAAASVLNGEVVVGVRPESFELAPDGIPARVDVVEELGSEAYAFCRAQLAGEERRVVARVDARRPPGLQERIALRPRAEELHLFDPRSGARLDA
jgi:multiple sugar transport system ATP-binding protein